MQRRRVARTSFLFATRSTIRKAKGARRGESHPSSASMVSLQKSGVFATSRQVSTLESRLTSLSLSTGFCRVSCGNPLKRSLPWRASPRNFPTTSLPTRRRRWWRPRRAARSGWSCASCSGPAFGCRVPVPPAGGPPAQPGPSDPQPAAERARQQAQAEARGRECRRP